MTYILGQDAATIFSSAAFCRIWANALGELSWSTIGQKRDLGCVFRSSRILKLKSYQLSPNGLYWGSETDQVELQQAFAGLGLQLCRRWDCYQITWVFRYDAQEQMRCVVGQLGKANCHIKAFETHIIPIMGKSYGEIVSTRLKPVTRQQIRYGLNSGIDIRSLTTPEDVDQYFSLYRMWASRKNTAMYPRDLFAAFVTAINLPVTILGAFVGGTLSAAITVFHGQTEWLYWHSVRDAEHGQKFAIDALLANSIEDACKRGILYFNLGASSNIQSLEFFKERWGGEKRTVWHLDWNKPVWQIVMPILHRVNSFAGKRGS